MRTRSLRLFFTKRWLLVPFAVLLVGGSSPQTGSLGTSAAVIAKCSVNTSTLSFGAYDPVVTNNVSPLDVSPSSLSIQCTRGAPSVTVNLSLGANAVGSLRNMSDGAGHTLQYEIYTTAARATVWNATNSVGYASTGMAAGTLTLYGRIPGGQDAYTAASYTDTVVATVNF